MQGTQYCSAIAPNQNRHNNYRANLCVHVPQPSMQEGISPHLSPICSPSRVAVTFPKQDVTPLRPGSSTDCHLQFNLPSLLFQTFLQQKHCTTFPIYSVLCHQVSKLKVKLVSHNPFLVLHPLPQHPDCWLA